MTLREVLQIELWSRETSRRITRRIWRIAKPVLIASGVVVLLAFLVLVVEWRWLTNGERKAGQAALAKIDELQQLETHESGGFDATNDQAKALTAVAQQKAWTLRDRQAAGLLELYRWDLETDHESRTRDREIKAFMVKRHQKWRSNPELDRKMRDLRAQGFSSMSSLLHKDLD